MATNIPPHNLCEVLDAVILLIEDRNVTFAQLSEVLPGPDFPTAGFIHGVRGIQEAYLTGRGIIQVRARARIEEMPKDRQRIIVTEIPYQVNKARLIEKMADLVRDKKVEGISDLRDESDREGIRIVIELKRGEVAEVILNSLYKLTQLQTSFGINMLAIVDNKPQLLNLKEILIHFLNHRKTVVIRRIRFDLRKAENRAHILEGLLKALDHIDEIITTIRASQTPEDARADLVRIFSFTETQAKAILDMRLQRLTGLEREKLVAEYKDLMEFIERLRAIMASDSLLLNEIRVELLQIREAYGDERRTEIIQATHDISIEDMIADEDMVITVTRAGYVKRSPLAIYREQVRGGKGRKGMETRDDDFVEHLYIASAHSYILVFTESGRVHWLKVHRIPELSPASRGKAIVNLLQLEKTEKIATTFAVRNFDDGFLVFATINGTIKKTELKAFSNPRVGGIIAINIDEDDKLLGVRLTNGDSDVLLATAGGYSIRFPERDEEVSGSRLTGVRAMGRAARGVRGISLRPNDRVVAMEALDSDGDLLSVSSNGYGKRTLIDEYRRQSRGGKGIINLKVTDKTGEVIAVKQVLSVDGMILITQGGKLIRSGIHGVSQIGRATQGVKLIDLNSEDRVVAVAKIGDRGEENVEDIESAQETGIADELSSDTSSENEPVN